MRRMVAVSRGGLSSGEWYSGRSRLGIVARPVFAPWPCRGFGRARWLVSGGMAGLGAAVRAGLSTRPPERHRRGAAGCGRSANVTTNSRRRSTSTSGSWTKVNCDSHSPAALHVHRMQATSI